MADQEAACACGTAWLLAMPAGVETGPGAEGSVRLPGICSRAPGSREG